MAFDPVEFYRLGGEIFNRQDGSEREYRTVIGRAYYGAFLAARDKAGITSASGSIHLETANHYLKTNQSAIGNRLNGLRLQRNAADYDLSCQISSRNAGEALKLSLRLLKDLGAIS